jgi:hypothetical protein
MRSASMMPTDEAHELRYIRLETLPDPKGSWMKDAANNAADALNKKL